MPLYPSESIIQWLIDGSFNSFPIFEWLKYMLQYDALVSDTQGLMVGLATTAPMAPVGDEITSLLEIRGCSMKTRMIITCFSNDYIL